MKNLFYRIYLFFWNLEYIIITDNIGNGALGAAFYPHIYISKRVRHRKQFDRVVNHERIHHAQQIELLVVPFLIWYYAEYLYYFIIKLDKYAAYRSIRFERECFQNEKDLNYLAKRKPYNYLFPAKKTRKKRSRVVS
jgi:hypothetical protein